MTHSHSVRPIRIHWEMKTGLRKVAFEVRVWLAVIVPRRGGLQKLSGEHASVSKAQVQPLVQLIFRDQIEFVANVVRTRMGRNRNGSTTSVEPHPSADLTARKRPGPIPCTLAPSVLIWHSRCREMMSTNGFLNWSGWPVDRSFPQSLVTHIAWHSVQVQ
jgi:hypothetical protein